ncbi:MAG: thioredoxin-disulfide reductase [bacterium]
MSLNLATKPKVKTMIVQDKEKYDVIIIGGGPAGLSAAIYSLRSALKTILIEKMVIGGTASTAYQIENYPGIKAISGLELGQKMENQAKELGLEVLWGDVTAIKKGFEVVVGQKTLKAKTVIIAAGTQTAKLDVPGEEKLRGRGVSYCATCDGPFYQGKNIFVVGGGNSAIEEALFLTRFAAKVSIVHRRDKLRADKILADRANKNPKLYFFWHSTLNEIIGQDKVTEVVLTDLISKKKLRVPADGVFIYVGSKPNSEIAKGLVAADDKGFILTDDKMATLTPGLFAAGDVRAKTLRQIVTAAADGALAADSARDFIENA